MLNTLIKKIRQYWHDLYYFLASKAGVDFAMTCQDATAKIDLRDQNKSAVDKARVNLHISLCQACNNYYTFSRVLSLAIKKLLTNNTNNKSEIDNLNKELLKRHSKQ